jgi:Tol biopolymer transport system component
MLNVEDGSVRVVTRDPTNEVEPNWSRDGRWIYFESDVSGRQVDLLFEKRGKPKLHLEDAA